MLKNDPQKNNPCLKEQELTYKCFNDNNYDKEKCHLEIENYKVCKGFWNYVRMERKRKGVYPHIPPVEEREHVKNEYFEKIKTT